MRTMFFIAIAIHILGFQANSYADQRPNYQLIPSLHLLDLILAKERAGIVNENRVNVRSGASLGSSKVAQLNRGNIVRIYAEQGTGKVESNIWDYWYKIDQYESRWINALFIDVLPIMFSARFPAPPFMDPQQKELYTEHTRFLSGHYIADRSKQKTFHKDKEDYLYYISTLSDLHQSINNDIWLHASAIEPFLGSPCRRLEITYNPLLDFPLVLRDTIENIFKKPLSVRNIGPEYSGFLPTIRYDFGSFIIDVQDKQAEKIQFLHRVIIAAPVEMPLVKYGINVGVEKKYLLNCLGRPDAEKDKDLFYNHPDPGNVLVITIEDERIARIEWVAEVP